MQYDSIGVMCDVQIANLPIGQGIDSSSQLAIGGALKRCQLCATIYGSNHIQGLGAIHDVQCMQIW